MSLRDKIILVTGAANGMGESTARRLGVEGVRVVLTDVETDRMTEVAKSMTEAGVQVLQYELDVTNRAQVQSVFDSVESKWGVPYGVAHIAGMAVVEPFLESTDKVWDKTIAVNLTGTFYVSQVAARAMVKAKIAGSIVLMASTNGIVGEENLAAYNASKFGVVGLTKTLAIDLAPYNIRVNSVNPGLIKTRLTQNTWENPELVGAYTSQRIPMRRLGGPEEVASCFIFLLSDDSSYVTGHSLVVDGGQLTF